MNESIISWTDVTWNPTHGCHKISEGCRNCYAASLSIKRGWTELPWTKPNAEANVQTKPHKLREPYKLKQPSRVFVNSMSDLGHENIPGDYLRQIFEVMNELPQHTFQILTKRPENLIDWPGPWTANIHMGASVEDIRAKRRIDDLRAIPAAVRFLSCEPLLESLGILDLQGISWVIVGGESGSGWRPMKQAWARDIRDQCVAANVAFFYKQDAAFRTETRPWLTEADGSSHIWHQFPGSITPPLTVSPAVAVHP